MLPTADDVAVAIAAACRETGEDIRDFGPNGKGATCARHYALHALIHVFPKAAKFKLCEFVLCPGKPVSYWSVSWNVVNGKHPALWFKPEAYDRVIRAIEADRTRRAVAQQKPAVARPAEPLPYRPPTPHPKLGTRDANGYRPPASAIVEELEDELAADRPVFDRSVAGGFRKPRQDTFVSSRRAVEEELRQAAANTSRMQERLKE